MALIALIGMQAWQYATTPEPVMPGSFVGLQPELVKLLQGQISVVQANPRDPNAHAKLGLIYEANQFWPEAHQCFQTAAALDSNQPKSVHHAATARYMSSDVAGALREWRRAALRFPDFGPTLNRLGDLLMECGRMEEAADAFKRLLRAAPQRYEGYVGLGDVRLRTGQYQEAADLLEQAVRIEPQYTVAHYLLGTAYRALGRHGEAALHMQRGVSGKRRYLEDAWAAELPKYAMTLRTQLERGRKLLESGRAKEAVTLFEAMLANNPENVRVIGNLGLCYIKAGHLNDALHTLLGGKRLDESDVEIAINLAACYLALDRADEARKEMERLVGFAPDLWKAHHLRGLAMIMLGEKEAAYDSLRQAIQLNPRHPKPYHKLGDICTELERFEEARLLYQTATKRWPNYLPAHIGLAKVSLHLREWEDASQALRTAGSMAPNHPTVVALSNDLEKMKKHE